MKTYEKLVFKFWGKTHDFLEVSDSTLEIFHEWSLCMKAKDHQNSGVQNIDCETKMRQWCLNYANAPLRYWCFFTDILSLQLKTILDVASVTQGRQIMYTVVEPCVRLSSPDSLLISFTCGWVCVCVKMCAHTHLQYGLPWLAFDVCLYDFFILQMTENCKLCLYINIVFDNG